MSARDTATEAPLREVAYEALLQKILDGDLPAGTPLREARLSSELGVSRTPLREALFRLEREGLVKSEQDKGYSVRALTEREVREVYPIIVALEVLALQESGTLVISLLDDLERLNAQLSKARRDPHRAIALDGQWHDKMISLCPNKKVLAMISGLRRTIFRYETVYMSDDSLVNNSVQQHAEIIEHLRAGRMEAAIKAVQHNYRFGMDAVIQRISAEHAE